MKTIRFVVSALLLILSSTAEAQILKEHKQILLNGNVINYTTQSEVPSGLFKVYKDVEKNELVRGNYVDGERKGNWYFFNYDSSLFLRYNYDVNKVVYLDQKALSNVEVNVNISEDKKKMASIPTPLWSFDSFYLLATENAIKVVDADHRKYLINRNVKIKVIVGENGLAKYFVIYQVGKTDYQKEFMIDDKMLDIKWVPSTLNGVRYASEVTFLTRFSEVSPGVLESGHKRINWN